jgi:hypothetical protein
VIRQIAIEKPYAIRVGGQVGLERVFGKQYSHGWAVGVKAVNDLSLSRRGVREPGHQLDEAVGRVPVGQEVKQHIRLDEAGVVERSRIQAISWLGRLPYQTNELDIRRVSGVDANPRGPSGVEFNQWTPEVMRHANACRRHGQSHQCDGSGGGKGGAQTTPRTADREGSQRDGR